MNRKCKIQFHRYNLCRLKWISVVPILWIQLNYCGKGIPRRMKNVPWEKYHWPGNNVLTNLYRINVCFSVDTKNIEFGTHSFLPTKKSIYIIEIPFMASHIRRNNVKISLSISQSFQCIFFGSIFQTYDTNIDVPSIPNGIVCARGKVVFFLVDFYWRAICICETRSCVDLNFPLIWKFKCKIPQFNGWRQWTQSLWRAGRVECIFAFYLSIMPVILVENCRKISGKCAPTLQQQT